MEKSFKPLETNTFCLLRRSESEQEFEEAVDKDYHMLGLPLCRGKVTTMHGQKTSYDGPVWPGMACLLSPGEQARTIIRVSFDRLKLRIPGHIVRSIIAATGNTHRPGDSLYINPLLQPNAEVNQLARSLLHVKEFDSSHAQLYLDGLVISLLACLLHHHASGLPVPRHTKGFSSKEFEAIVGFADASMEATLNLDGWAAVVDMPAPEFTRRFRASTGSAPYAWFMRRRIERAKELLLKPKLSLCDVALIVGFSSQSHFTEAFSRRVGFPPARWRQMQIGAPSQRRSLVG